MEINNDSKRKQGFNAKASQVTLEHAGMETLLWAVLKLFLRNEMHPVPYSTYF